MQRARLLWRAAQLALALICAGAAQAAPMRVVSMNLCTDQMAMMLAGPGQLMSVSYLARDPHASSMAQEAKAYPVNYGRAEEIYLLKPDLVIAGSFTTRATVDMLRRLGTPVAVIDPAYSLEEVRARITQMGAYLGREAAAAQLVAEFDAGLAQIPKSDRPLRAATYYARGYTSGTRSLAHEILQAAGLSNIASELGLSAGGTLPLEQLALADPDFLVTGRDYGGRSRAEEVLDHPVLRHLKSTRAGTSIADRDWVCGTPFVLRAIKTLAAERP
ncbi:MAG: ABC transporter substrate-binding protein [Mangrovicoccus sp.]|nr:ABC transporter substrate-binding protein [Mangrovicoccus sp.]